MFGGRNHNFIHVVHIKFYWHYLICISLWIGILKYNDQPLTINYLFDIIFHYFFLWLRKFVIEQNHIHDIRDLIHWTIIIKPSSSLKSHNHTLRLDKIATKVDDISTIIPNHSIYPWWSYIFSLQFRDSIILYFNLNSYMIECLITVEHNIFLCYETTYFLSQNWLRYLQKYPSFKNLKYLHINTSQKIICYEL